MVALLRLAQKYRWGMLCVALGIAAVPCGAAPRLHTGITNSGGQLCLTIAGSGLPAMKRLSLTFSYDPLRVNAANATVASRLPPTMFGALLDTTAKKLEVNIVATSTLIVSEGAVISVVRIASPATGDPLSALFLTAALCIDNDGNRIVPEIDKTAIRAPGPKGRDRQFAVRRAAVDHCFTLNGRACSKSVVASAGVRVGAGSGVLILRTGNQ